MLFIPSLHYNFYALSAVLLALAQHPRRDHLVRLLAQLREHGGVRVVVPAFHAGRREDALEERPRYHVQSHSGRRVKSKAPFSVQRRVGRAQIYDLIVELNRAGKTILLTSNYPDELKILCDQVPTCSSISS